MEIGQIISNEELYRIIVEFQKEHKTQYGINIKALCEKEDWRLVEYNSTHPLYKISKDGFSIPEKNEFYIFYNKDMPPKRVNFTIAHEIGHLAMCHHFIEKKGILMFGENSLLEKQANTFAQNLLMPADKILALKNHSLDDIANYFNVSKKMAEVRLSRLKEDLYYINQVQNI